MSTSRIKFVCVCVALLGTCWCICASLVNQYHRNIIEEHDLIAAIVRYMERHDGEFPESEMDLLTSPTVSRNSSGRIIVHNDSDSANAGNGHEYPIENVSRFRVKWGTTLSTLMLRTGIPRDRQNAEVFLVESPFGDKSSRAITRLLLDIGKDLKDVRRPMATRPN